MNGAVSRILCVDDHPIVRAGLRALIDSQTTMRVVGEADDAPSAREAVASLDPDIVVMDVRLRGSSGIDLTRELVAARPDLRVIMLSSYVGDEEIHRALAAGARGYVLKEFAAQEILVALEQVRRGNRYLSTEISHRLARNGPRVTLTPAEQSVLFDILQGFDASESANRLAMTIDEVEGCRRRLSAKFDCENHARLAITAIARGFFDINAADAPRDPSEPVHRPGQGGLAPWQLRRAQDYMEARIGEQISLEEVAASVQLSSFHFSRAFKRTIGLPPHAWLTAMRMERACALMRNDPKLCLTEIAHSVGYQSQTAFGSVFRRHYGLAPGQWRRACEIAPTMPVATDGQSRE